MISGCRHINSNIKTLILSTSLWLLCEAVSAFDLSPEIMHLQLLTTQEAAINNNGFDDLTVEAKAFSVQSIVGKHNLYRGDLIYHLHYEYRDVDITDDDQLQLHTIAAGIQYLWQNDDWTQILKIEPGIYSNLKDIDADDWGLALRYTAVYSESSTWSPVWGVGSDRQFGEPRIYPILGAIYSPNATLRLALAFPKTQLDFHFSKNWNLSSHIQPIGNQWNVNQQTLQYPRLPNQPSGSVDFVAKGYQFVIALEGRISEQFWLGMEWGYLFKRGYELKDDDSLELSIDLESTPMAGIAMKMRL